MQLSRLKLFALSFITSSLLFAACGKQLVEPESTELTIPAAPDAAIQMVIAEFAKGNGGIIWKAMPASYQDDINSLVQLAGSKIDAEIYDKSFAMIDRLAEVVDQQQGFILGSSFMQARSAEELAQFQAALPSFVGMIHAITSSELASVAGMINFNGQSFCDTTVSKFAEYTKALGDLAGESLVLSDYTNAVVSIVASDELQATLLTSIPGQVPQEQVFTKIEGRWVPMEMANGWAAQMAEATASLEAISPESVASQKPQMMGILTMIDGVLTQIAAAETQEQFDQSLQGAMMPLMGLMMMGQGLGAPAVPAAPVLK